MTLSGILRVEHDTDHPYKVINMAFANDARLTWAARGLLVYLLSKPDSWQVMVPDLIKQSPAGRDAVYAILKNLETCGYLHRIRNRREDGTFEFSTVVYEASRPLPAFPDTAQPEEVNPDTAEPDTAEPLPDKPDVLKSKERINKERPIKQLAAAASSDDDEEMTDEEADRRAAAILLKFERKNGYD